jgi:hypothetical protein
MMFGRTLMLTAAALLPLSVHAGETPKEGTVKTTNTWVLSSYVPMKMGERSFATFEVNGIKLNYSGGGIFDKMSARFLGTLETNGKDYHATGASIYMDVDGDAIYGTFESRAQGRGHGQLIAGTGKYAGISGETDWVEYTAAHPIKADDKFPRGLVTETIHWKLPEADPPAGTALGGS